MKNFSPKNSAVTYCQKIGDLLLSTLSLQKAGVPNKGRKTSFLGIRKATCPNGREVIFHFSTTLNKSCVLLTAGSEQDFFGAKE